MCNEHICDLGKTKKWAAKCCLIFSYFAWIYIYTHLQFVTKNEKSSSWRKTKKWAAKCCLIFAYIAWIYTYTHIQITGATSRTAWRARANSWGRKCEPKSERPCTWGWTWSCAARNATRGEDSRVAKTHWGGVYPFVCLRTLIWVWRIFLRDRERD